METESQQQSNPMPETQLQTRQEGDGHARTSESPEDSIEVQARQRLSEAKEAGRGAVHRVGAFLSRPHVAGTVTGAAVLGVAATIGVWEAAVAAGAGYATFRILKRGSAKGRSDSPEGDERARGQENGA
jgi:predicted phage tail protein